VRAAFEVGGTGYVLKSAMLEELREAVQSVLGGRMYVSAGIPTEHLERLQDRAAASTPRLSKRELAILQLIAEGGTAEEIARAKKISLRTVAFHGGNIKRKLGLRTSSELTQRTVLEQLRSGLMGRRVVEGQPAVDKPN
jgi:DNA-binding NarL/FixJ family response regulator